MTMQFLLHSYNFKKMGHLSYYPPSAPKKTGFGFALFGFFRLGLVWVFFCLVLGLVLCFVFKE